MKKLLLTAALMLGMAMPSSAQVALGHHIDLPDIDGYLTLKGDMHIHTIFSDGSVWPTTRVDEAYLDGLDFVCITDHVDGRLKKMVKKGLFNADRNESYKIAQKEGKKMGVIVVHGGEVTRDMPPGHFNVTFITDNDKIGDASDAQQDHFKGMEAALKEARRQGGFITWNHPHWVRHAPNGPKWYPEHTKLYEAGLMDGIECYNQWEGISMEAFHWAMERNLTPITGTDVHKPMDLWIDYYNGELRPVQLVFAKERTEASIHEALKEHRAAIMARGNVYGAEKWLRPLLKAVLQVKGIKYSATKAIISVHNATSLPIQLSKAKGYEGYGYTRFITIPPHSDYDIKVTMAVHKAPFDKQSFDIGYDVSNFWTDADKNLTLTLHLESDKMGKKK